MIKKINFIYKKNLLFSEYTFKKHFNIYNNNLNKLNKYLLEKKIFFKNIFELIDLINDLPDLDKFYFSNLLGNYLNHFYYFKNLTFDNFKIFGNIKKKIFKSFNSLENFNFNFINFFKNFIGWGWLVINNNQIFFVKTKENINPIFPISIGGYNSIPLICIDLHEHAIDNIYYLENFLKFLNWYEIENRLQNYSMNIT